MPSICCCGRDVEEEEEEVVVVEEEVVVEEQPPAAPTPPPPTPPPIEDESKEWRDMNDGKAHLPDKHMTAAEREAKRLSDRKRHEAQLREVRGERKIERRQSLMKKKKEAFSRRVLVLEDAAAANAPSKLSNPFLDQFGAKKVKAPETLWASPKEKVGKILHLKKGETPPEGAIEIPEPCTPLDRKTMELKHNFKFTEIQLEEEFGFHYATDSDKEDEDDSFIPVDERTLADGRVLLPEKQ